jgi:molybdopterin-guanine dinucleotide biosynthesis protein A
MTGDDQVTANEVLPLNGLIAAGGHSERMGREKGGISYRSRPEVQRLYHQLTPFCREVYVSIRADQSDQFWCEERPQIHDLFDDLGPVSGLLSAMIHQPNTPWLFVACDMPFVDRGAVRRLVQGRDASRTATVYQRSEAHAFEPVFGIYEPEFLTVIRDALGSGTRSLHNMLEQEQVRTVPPARPQILTSVDTPFERQRVQRYLRGIHHE